MLLLLFDTRDGRYALPTEHIIEVVPLVKLKKIPKSPDYVSGLINYRGNPVPVIDLCVLADGPPCEPRFSTRIIMLNYPLENNTSTFLGLMAEHVTETVKAKTFNMQQSRVLIDEDITVDTPETNHEEIIQKFDLRRMVPEKIISGLLKI